MPRPPQLAREDADTLAGPSQGRLRVPVRRRLDELLLRPHQAGVMLRRALSPAARAADPQQPRPLLPAARHRRSLLQFLQPGGDRGPGQPRRASHRAHAAVAPGPSLAGRPQSTSPLIKHSAKCLELRSDRRHRPHPPREYFAQGDNMAMQCYFLTVPNPLGSGSDKDSSKRKGSSSSFLVRFGLPMQKRSADAAFHEWTPAHLMCRIYDARLPAVGRGFDPRKCANLNTKPVADCCQAVPGPRT
jgi:hypothetical protein